MKGDHGHPIILISIGPHTLEAICHLGAGMNVIPMVVYDNVFRLALLLRTNMRVRFADRSTRHVEGFTDDVCVLVRDSYMVSHFVVLDTGREQTTPIIFG